MNKKSSKRHRETHDLKTHDTNECISNNLRLLRRINNLSQEETAHALNMSRSCYASLERSSKTADISVLSDISLFYDIKFEYIIDFDIADQILPMLRKGSHDTDIISFITRYSLLSGDSKKQIREIVNSLSSNEAERVYHHGL